MTRKLLGLALLPLLGSLALAQRLPQTALPENYQLTLSPDFSRDKFSGDETIRVRLLQPSSQIILNSAEIDFQDASISIGSLTQKAAVTLDAPKEMATLTVEKPLAPGIVLIHIKYTGTLNNQLRGFYLGKDDHGQKYALTQFESTDARRAFPCFDEPGFKATFDISIITDRGLTAISNAPAVSDTPGPAEGQHTLGFAPTRKMSAYLVAFAVGNFEYIEGSADGIPIRVYSMPGKRNLSRYGLEVAELCLHYFDQYFGVKYPYGKLDLIGVGDFSAGAMENVGLITSREALLQTDEQHASLSEKKIIAIVISHEIAHQWFGDLVTPKWWDDVWLNEGFATWAESKPLDDWKPEWHFLIDEVGRGNIESTVGAMNVDSLASTRAIHQPADTPDQITELFDGIAYGKAGAVLRMLEAYLGPETFRAGVNEYVKLYAEANATSDDFWVTLARVSHKPVDQIMATFVNQPGIPVIGVNFRCSGASTIVTLNQQRYFYDRALFNSSHEELWKVPVCMRTETASQAGNRAPRCELLTRKEDTFTLPGCSSWLLANGGGNGFYRTSYAPEALQALARSAESQLTPIERLILLEDTWASVRVGRSSVPDYLTLAKGLQDESSAGVLGVALAQLVNIDRSLVTENDRAAYQAWVRGFLQPIARRIGWQNRPGDDEDRRDLRPALMRALGLLGNDPDTIAEARALAERALSDPASVDRDLAGAALVVTAHTADAAFYNRVRTALSHARTPAEYYIYFFALASFGNPQLLQRTLEFAISSDVRSQDALRLVSLVMLNPSGETLAWNFVQSHWPQLENIGGAFASGEILTSTGTFCDARLKDQVNDFFTAHNGAGTRTFRQSMEKINECVDLKTQQAAPLASWLARGGSSSAGASAQ